MTVSGWIQILVFAALVVAVTRPLGGYMTRVFSGERTLLARRSRPGRARRSTAWPASTRRQEQGWVDLRRVHAAVQRGRPAPALRDPAPAGRAAVQPARLRRVPADLAFNTAVSFTTNTNWQNYGGETTMSYLTQMAGLTVHNFLSAATGIALAVALIRGFARRSTRTSATSGST